MKRIEIVNFSEEHIDEAMKIALDNYNEERVVVAALPSVETVPDLSNFVNSLGVAAFSNAKMVGFLCCHEPWENAFNTTATGTFSPIHANGALSENRAYTYRRMYQAAAEKWVASGITYHSIGLYAHDAQAVNALFTYGFGLRCVDAIMPLEKIKCDIPEGVTFRELSTADKTLWEMRGQLSLHLSQSPTFMRTTPEAYEKWIIRAESRSSRVFAAIKNGEPIAYMELMDEGENFAAGHGSIKNICGAYCLPEHRGNGLSTALLNHVITEMKADGYDSLGVDFESINPTANGFWLKYFTAYTSGVTRRIDP